MIKTVIFDLDGTLSDTIESIKYFANNTLANHGLKTATTEQFKVFVGDGARTLVKRLLKNAGVENDPDLLEKVLYEYNTTYDNDFLYLTKPYDGIPELLKALSEMGIKTAVLSNKPHPTTSKIAEVLFSDHEFDIVCGQKEGIPVKPDPTSVFDIIEKLGADKSECLYIGDTGTDMQTAKNAGLFSIGVLWGFRDESDLKDANLIVSHPREILEFIEGGKN